MVNSEVNKVGCIVSRGGAVGENKVRSEDDKRFEILSDSVDTDGREGKVLVSVWMFVTQLDAVTTLPWQVRGNQLCAHSSLIWHYHDVDYELLGWGETEH